MPGVTESEITRIDSDGPAVYELVMEVKTRDRDGVREPKAEYRRASCGTEAPRAKDTQARRSHQQPHDARISQRRGVREAVPRGDPDVILPYAEGINRTCSGSCRTSS